MQYFTCATERYHIYNVQGCFLVSDSLSFTYNLHRVIKRGLKLCDSGTEPLPL